MSLSEEERKQYVADILKMLQDIREEKEEPILTEEETKILQDALDADANEESILTEEETKILQEALDAYNEKEDRIKKPVSKKRKTGGKRKTKKGKKSCKKKKSRKNRRH